MRNNNDFRFGTQEYIYLARIRQYQRYPKSKYNIESKDFQFTEKGTY